MHHLKDPLFYAVFNQLPEARLIVRIDDQRLTIVASNQANNRLVKAEQELSGKNLWEANYPQSFGGEPDALKEGLAAASAGKKTIFLPPFRNQPDLSPAVTAWFQIEINPITEKENEVVYFILTVHDCTKMVGNEFELQQLRTSEAELLREQQVLNEELAATNEELMATNDDLNESREKLLVLNQELEERVRERTHDLFLSEQKAHLLIKDAPVAIAVLTGEQLVIESANTLILDFWKRTAEIIGMPLLVALPELTEQPFPGLLRDVLHTGVPYHAFESPAVIRSVGEPFTRYYNFVFHPVKDEAGSTVSVMIVASDVSLQVNAKKQIEESELRLKRMVMTTPFALAIMKTKDLIVEAANKPMLSIWSKTDEEVLGKRLLDVLPELRSQSFPVLLSDVLDTGRRIALPEVLSRIDRPDGTLHEHYLTISCDPLFDGQDRVEGILVSVSDITEMVQAKRELQERQEALEALNEEVNAGNEELASINEELTASNEELQQTQQELQQLYNKISESEDLFRSIFEQSPLGMCILRGPDHVIAEVNDNMLEIWGRKLEEVINLPHRIARPELNGQPVFNWLDEVFQTGETRVNSELQVFLYAGEGIKREAYVNSVYQPLRDSNGAVYGILAILDEVTERIYERKQAEIADEQFRLAVESASLGTWYIDIDSQEFVASDRLKELFGFCPNEAMSLEAASDLVLEEYRERVTQAMQTAISSGEAYDFEYPIRRRNDRQLRWLKATGRLYKDESKGRNHFSGTIQDITERRLEEGRKNDFIAIASHELKTPLTSTKAYIQLLQSRSEKSGDEFTMMALAKVDQQINKMQSLIKGFLDVARIESGRLDLQKELFLFHELIKEAADEVMAVSQGYNIMIEQNDVAEVIADRYKIFQVLDNLLRNAVKYSPYNRTIYVRSTCDSSKILVSVRDEGIGISKADMQGLFGRFYRVENPNTAHISGFGVGLYICSEIVRHHNGRIWAESIPGKGSTFFFSIPLEG